MTRYIELIGQLHDLRRFETAPAAAKALAYFDTPANRLRATQSGAIFAIVPLTHTDFTVYVRGDGWNEELTFRSEGAP